MGTATAPGCSEADTYAGASIAPYGDVSLTTSPPAMPNFAAVSVEISTQASHTDCVIVSGASWSHERQEHVADRPRIADRRHRGLHEPEHALARGIVAPALEPVDVGEDQVRQRRGLVGLVRETHDERNLREGLGELETAGQRERGIH